MTWPVPPVQKEQRTTLDQQTRENALRNLPDWTFQENALVRTLSFPDFRAAIGFVNHVADIAEGAQHHPDLDIRYTQVRIALTTHSAGGLTAKDFDVARQIDALIQG